MKKTGEKKIGRKASTAATSAAQSNTTSTALEREAHRRGISAAAVMRQEREAHKRANVRGKLYRAPITDGAATADGSATKKNRTENANRETARMARWMNEIEAQLKTISANPNRRVEFKLVKTAAAIAGMSPARFILDAMKREHGLTGKPSFEAQCVKRTDEEYENAPTRERNAHERESVATCIMHYSFAPFGLTQDEKVGTVRHFFKPGDRSLADAEERAIREALKTRTATERGQAANEVKYPAHIIEEAAREAGMTPAEYVAKTRTFNASRPMSARHVKTEKGVATFIVEPMIRKARAMKLEDFTPGTQKAIKALAAERGTTPEAVCRRFDELIAGEKASGKRDPIFKA